MNAKPILLLLPFLCFSCSQKEEPTPSVEEERIQAIQLRSASQSADDARTISYQVYPVTSSQKVNYTLSFSDGSDASDCLTASLDETAKTVTLTCLKAFSQEARLTLSSQLESSVKAVASINYTRKLLGIGYSGNAWYTELTSTANFPEGDPAKKAEEMYLPEFSEYSKLADPSEKVVQKVEKHIIVPYKSGKYSAYGNIDQSNTTLRDCPVGAPLLSYFENLYKGFSKEEKKAVNAFGKWGLIRYYNVTMSYNGATYEKYILHVISFNVNSLSNYDPTV